MSDPREINTMVRAPKISALSNKDVPVRASSELGENNCHKTNQSAEQKKMPVSVGKQIKVDLTEVVESSKKRPVRHSRKSDMYARNLEGHEFQVSESFKLARTNIDFAVVKDGCKIITISSCFAQEGKTTFSTNIAKSFAQIEGNRVLLIDCDMRKPKVHRAFSISVMPGLSDHLVKSLPINDVLHWQSSSNLFVMSAGTIVPSAAELISSDRFQQVLGELSQYFDYIFLDTPPVLVVADALSAIPLSDGVVIVVNYKKTLIPQLGEALDAIQTVNGKVLGVILNQVPLEDKSYGGRYSGNYAYEIYGGTYEE